MRRSVVRPETAPKAKPFSSALQNLADFPQTALRTPGVSEAVRRTMDEAFAQGRAEGYAAGAEEGRAAVEASLQEAVSQFMFGLERTAQSLEQEYRRFLESSEEELGALAIALAVKLLGSELQMRPDAAMQMVREALAEVSHAARIKIKANPFSAGLLREQRAELLAQVPSSERIEILDDPSIAEGCMIETEASLVDGTLESRVEALFDALRNRSTEVKPVGTRPARKAKAREAA